MKIDHSQKVVIHTILVTLLAMVVLSGISFLTLSLFLPRTLADFSYDLGLTKVARYYYEKTYNQTNEIDDLYRALTVSGVVGDAPAYVRLYELWQDNDESEAFLADREEALISSGYSNLNLSLLLNEKNYLANRYVGALLQLNETQIALTFAETNFVQTGFTLNDLDIYAYANLLQANYQAEVADLFSTSSFSSALINYFANLNTLFVEYEDATLTNLQKSQMLYLGLRMQTVGVNLYFVATQTTLDLSVEEIETILSHVGDKLPTYL